MNRRIEEIRERLARVGVEKWYFGAAGRDGVVRFDGGDISLVCETPRSQADAECIVNAPSDIAYLLEQVAILTIERDGANERARMVLESKSAIIDKLTRELSEAREAQRWIPVKEKPPERGKNVAILFGGGINEPHTSTGYLNSEGQWIDVGLNDVRVAAPILWCELPPLPPPPKTEGDL